MDELAGERIDIVRWNDSLQVLVPNAMQPSEVEDVILCPMLGRVIVLVREDQLSLAIGKRGQNVRLASKLVGWDIEVMTRDELNEQLDKSVAAFGSIDVNRVFWAILQPLQVFFDFRGRIIYCNPAFSQVPHITEELAESLVSQGFFSFYDLSVIEPDQLQEMSGLTPEECEEIVAHADDESEKQEHEETRRKAEMKLQREIDARTPAASASVPSVSADVAVVETLEVVASTEEEAAPNTETEPEPPASVVTEPTAE